MTAEEILQQIQGRFGDEIRTAEVRREEACLTIRADRSYEICRFIKEELGYDYLNCLSGVDWPADNELEVAYAISSLKQPGKIMLRARVPRDEPVLGMISWGSDLRAIQTFGGFSSQRTGSAIPCRRITRMSGLSLTPGTTESPEGLPDRPRPREHVG
jgi:hypothetical protein